MSNGKGKNRGKSNNYYQRQQAQRRREQSREPFDPIGIEPVRITTTEAVPEVKQIELFSIDDKSYYIPEEFDPSLGLRYLRDLRDEGAEYATANLLTEVLGEDGLNDLAECRTIKKEQMARIVDVITEMAMAAVDEGKD